MHDRKNIGKLILEPSLEAKPKPATPAKKSKSSAEKEETRLFSSDNDPGVLMLRGMAETSVLRI